jgi:hypothetical protein
MTGGVHLSVGRGEGKGGAAGGVFLCGRWQSGRAPLAHSRPGREGEMGQPRGRGLVGRGGAAGWREEKRVGHDWAERADGPKATEKKFFSK